jgi:hypothetical protein
LHIELKDMLRQRWQLIGALFLVLLVGLLHLPFPFGGDQALFNLGARDMAEGHTLYGDFWELNQPGIYIFYLAGGSAFGFTEIGIHLFELLYWLAFCISAWLLLRHTLLPILAIWMPAGAVVAYYLASGPLHLTQKEMIVSFPLLVTAVCVHKAISDGRLRFGYLVLSGFAGGLVLLFKLILAPILLGFWVIALLSAIKAREKFGRIASGVALTALFSLIPLAIAFGVGALSGVGTTMLRTFFVLPTQIVAGAEPAKLGRLAASLRWFVSSFAAIIGLAVVGVAHVRTSVKPFVLHMLNWIGLGTVIILIQRTSWWEYHMLLLLVPTVYLAGLGLSSLEVSTIRNLKPWLGRALLLLTIPAALGPLTLNALARTAAITRFLASGSASDYRAHMSPTYADVASDIALLPPASGKRQEAVVFGNPLYLYLSGRRQAIPINGWALEFLTVDQWHTLTSEVKGSTAPYFFLAEEYRELIQARAPAIVEYLEREYDILSVSERGTWYRRRE